ncbi:MAG: sigma-54-dependent Fis family transcriptional regulator [Phycisphaerales bacterium]|nr:sigma-54-dependent Fis family transcriptional regulator [Phycisphaerales bacterium]
MAEAPARILIVDDDPIVAESLAEFLARQDYAVATAASATEALEAMTKAEREPEAPGQPPRPFDLVISDISMPRSDGLSLLREIARQHRGTAVVMLTGYGTIESAVESLRHGACDYLTKPIVDQELRLSLERALRQRALLRENQALRTQIDHRYGLDSIIGGDHRMLRIYDLIEAVAPSRTTVLMTGESGTGKSLIAHAIHHRSPRRDKPYVEISCGSIPETLLESELFGHVKGAFTGAHADKVGRFLAANHGTLFLDEINSASPGMQLKLLRVLQERRFEPVGSTQTIEVDVRVVLASNQPLEQLVAAGQFRQDLYYRINVVKVELPPLRDRVSDIPLLATHFLNKHAADLGKQIVGFTPEALDALRRYSYPGNIRELQNIIERAAVLTRHQTIDIGDLPPTVSGDAPADALSRRLLGDAEAEVAAPWRPVPLEEALKEPEKRILLRALEANQWNRQKTADQLKINRTTLYKKMKAHGLDRPDDRVAG